MCVFFFPGGPLCSWALESPSLGKGASFFILDLIPLHSIVIVSLINWNCHLFFSWSKNLKKNWIFFILLQDFVSSSRGKGGLFCSWTMCLLLNFLEHHVALKFLSFLSCSESACWAIFLEFFMPKLSSLHVKT